MQTSVEGMKNKRKYGVLEGRCGPMREGEDLREEVWSSQDRCMACTSLRLMRASSL